jgi:hypothetical protein
METRRPARKTAPRPSPPSSPAWAWRCPAPSPSGACAAATPGCHCHAGPPGLHGPYRHWTRKRAGKTISRFVPDDQVEDYRQWIDNHRRLRELAAGLEDLTLAVAGQHSGYQARSRRTRQTSA